MKTVKSIGHCSKLKGLSKIKGPSGLPHVAYFPTMQSAPLMSTARNIEVYRRLAPSTIFTRHFSIVSNRQMNTTELASACPLSWHTFSCKNWQVWGPIFPWVCKGLTISCCVTSVTHFQDHEHFLLAVKCPLPSHFLTSYRGYHPRQRKELKARRENQQLFIRSFE